MIVYRCLPWDRDSRPRARGGALWFPRLLQGDGRHDAPDAYGCLYVSEEPVSPVVEYLARFRGTALREELFTFTGLPIAVAAIELRDGASIVDLDDPRVLGEEELRPSLVATHDRSRTQADARALYERHPDAVAIRWWSTFESLWPNLTLFDRAGPLLAARGIRALGLQEEVVRDAAAFLGLRIAT